MSSQDQGNGECVRMRVSARIDAADGRSRPEQEKGNSVSNTELRKATKDGAKAK